MAFIIGNFSSGRGTYNAGAGATSPAVHTYNGSTDEIATIIASGYFNDVAGSLAINDLIYTTSSETDPVAFIYVTAVTPDVTTAAFPT